MDAITLSVMVGEDRRLVIDLPPDTPVGPVDVVITPREKIINPAREAARAKLLAAGRLVTNIRAPEGTVPLSPEELLRIGQRPPGTKSLDEMIDEDRGPR